MSSDEAAEDSVRQRSNPIDFQAYELIGAADVPGGQVARLLGISKASAYKAKSRIAAEIRAEFLRMNEEAR
ncbi:MAG: hypothetical protein ACF8Q5_08130 [Phycisphaerales bacterium JB040]